MCDMITLKEVFDMWPPACLLSDSEATLGRVTTVDRIEKIRVNDQIEQMYRVRRSVEVAPRQTVTAKANYGRNSREA